MPAKIFISYRREDDPAAAARVRDGLAARFGNANLFMDVDNLLAGLRFDEELTKALAACDVFIAVIGARWMTSLEAKADSGDRDYVREEIAGALARKIVVIPVRVGREGQLPPLPRQDDLPNDIKALMLYQKHDITHEYFGRDVGALADAITQVRLTLQPATDKQRAPWGWIAAAAGGLLAASIAVAFYAGVAAPWSNAPAPQVKPQSIRPETISVDASAALERARAAAAKIEADAAATARAKAEMDALALAAAAAASARAEAEALAAKEAERKRAAAVPEITIRRSAAFGGPGGDPFDDSDANPKRLPITGLKIAIARNPVNAGQQILGRLEVVWGDVTSPMHGGGWPGAPAASTPVRFAPDEIIVRVTVAHRKYAWPSGAPPVWISGLKIRTNKDTYSFGQTDGDGVVVDACAIGPDDLVIGFHGRAGSYIDRLGCVIAQRPK